MTSEIVLSTEELREVTAFAPGCAKVALAIVEGDRPDDARRRTPLARPSWSPATIGRWGPTTSSRRAAGRPGLVDVLERFPAAPGGGGRVGELIRLLDADLRR